MKKTKLLMGMPITVEIADEPSEEALNQVFNYFEQVDNRFSTYKDTSEISLFNRGQLKEGLSPQMQEVFKLASQTKRQTRGYFNIEHQGKVDPSGLVKGWAIYHASLMLRKNFSNFYIEAGGDVEAVGLKNGGKWRVGIQNPFDTDSLVAVLQVSNLGIATSGTYVRGNHIYNRLGKPVSEIVSLTVVGPNIYEADRFATACFAMGKGGIGFLANQPFLEGYMIDRSGVATFTPGFKKYEVS